MVGKGIQAHPQHKPELMVGLAVGVAMGMQVRVRGIHHRLAQVREVMVV